MPEKTPKTEKIQDKHLQIRWMIRRDMPEVLGIEQESYENSLCEDDFLRCLRQRNCIGMVTEVDQKVLGFMIYELYKSKLSIINFAVHPDYRRQGIGTAMVDKLKDKLPLQRRTAIDLEIREKNLEAQLFFKSQDFRAVSIIREYFPDINEDAYIMRYSINNQNPVFTPNNRISQYFEKSY